MNEYDDNRLESGVGSRRVLFQRRIQYVFNAGVLLVFLLPAVLLTLFVPNALIDRPQISGFVTMVHDVLPQGWGFFTRDPREPAITIWEPIGQNRWEQTSAISNAAPKSLFGFDRTVRTEQYEIDALTQNTSSAGWEECKSGDVSQCLKNFHGSKTSTRSSGEDLRFCGELALVQQSPVPWAWAGTETMMPAEFRVIEAQCHHSERR
ncbi:antimicrobial peptide system protein, SdpA family [Actinopolyspora mzabensis]|uniref:Antimicrobial peptide system protein, SdpA family n=1 Tax=Actinopolyspora mzabensis TaxID=995066 RepID=A0A1G9CEG1_ACTMZ|nr:SdpA family antimicrobial peptide system protein [Actinopolyspora mzabensis]SDK49815.1 antimicrobial peptide system protein, SdpA family [Actinopolyspora mzabensis]